jgi:hypothetical protein
MYLESRLLQELQEGPKLIMVPRRRFSIVKRSIQYASCPGCSRLRVLRCAHRLHAVLVGVYQYILAILIIIQHMSPEDISGYTNRKDRQGDAKVDQSGSNLQNEPPQKIEV